MKHLAIVGLILALWGGVSHAAANDYGTVTVSSWTPSTGTLVIPESGSRRSWTIKNIGSQTIYCGFNVSVSTSTGMPIESNTAYEAGGDNRTFTGDVRCKAAAGSSGVEVRYWWWNR